jgi:hypothetical protein
MPVIQGQFQLANCLPTVDQPVRAGLRSSAGKSPDTRPSSQRAQVLETCLRRIYCSIVHLVVPKKPPRRAAPGAKRISRNAHGPSSSSSSNKQQQQRPSAPVTADDHPSLAAVAAALWKASVGASLCTNLCSLLRLLLHATAAAAGQALKHEGHCNRCCWIRPPGGFTVARRLFHNGSLRTPTPTPITTLTDCNPDSIWI